MSSKTLAFARFIIILNGIANALTGLLLLFAPEWFYANVADFPPFNRHFLGDIGAYTLTVGVGLLLIPRHPHHHRALIGVAALGSLVHVVNHLYDDFMVDHGNLAHLLSNTLPLFVLAILLLVVYWMTRPSNYQAT